jgi:hypothetical protein
MTGKLITLLKITGFAAMPLLYFACANPFDLRAVDEPDSGGGYVLPTEPEQMLANLQQAFATKDEILYGRSFADTLAGSEDFYFFPDPVNGPFIGVWPLARELSHFALLTREFSTLDLTFTEAQNDFQADSVFVRVAYVINLGNEGQSDFYRGDVLFKMRYDPSYLIIYGWEDFISESSRGDSTWSQLKRYYF